MTYIPPPENHGRCFCLYYFCGPVLTLGGWNTVLCPAGVVLLPLFRLEGVSLGCFWEVLLGRRRLMPMGEFYILSRPHVLSCPVYSAASGLYAAVAALPSAATLCILFCPFLLLEPASGAVLGAFPYVEPPFVVRYLVLRVNAA
jgi:hypothetical protein